VKRENIERLFEGGKSRYAKMFSSGRSSAKSWSSSG
jgi:hypothetical protein